MLWPQTFVSDGRSGTSHSCSIGSSCFRYVSALDWTKSNIDDIIAHLPPPIPLLGDFNAHSKDWGCPSNDCKGKIIGDLLMEHDLSLLNDGSTTCLLYTSDAADE